jgi:hypothetical protein
MNPEIYRELGVYSTPFPHVEYDRTYKRIQSLRETAPDAHKESIRAFHAVLFRFIAANEYREEFGTAPEAPHNFLQFVRQEKLLYGFFNNGYSVIDSYLYGMYALGSALDPTSFPFSTDKYRREVGARTTSKKFTTAFPDDPFATILCDSLNDKTYTEWVDIRRMLTHRAVPSRNHFLAGDRPSEWQLMDGIPINEQMIEERWSGFTRLVRILLTASAAFLESQLP